MLLSMICLRVMDVVLLAACGEEEYVDSCIFNAVHINPEQDSREIEMINCCIRAYLEACPRMFWNLGPKRSKEQEEYLYPCFDQKKIKYSQKITRWPVYWFWQMF